MEVETKFTEEEHIARAMLLGRKYDRKTHTYRFPYQGNTLRRSGILDAETLEPMSRFQFERRINEEYFNRLPKHY